MADYLNKLDKERQMSVLATQSNVEHFLEGGSITDEERSLLSNALESIIMFNKSIFKRCGKAHERAMRNLVDTHELVMLPIASPTIEEARRNVRERLAIEEMVNSIQEMNCFACDKKNYRNCKIFIGFDAMGKSGESNCEGCPFKY